MIISIAKDFTMTPGGRMQEQSSYSGEEFRENVLIPKIEEAISKGEEIIIDLDGTYGYPTSFLDESFGKLVNCFSEDVIRKIQFISEDEPSLPNDIKKYMERNR